MCTAGGRIVAVVELILITRMRKEINFTNFAKLLFHAVGLPNYGSKFFERTHSGQEHAILFGIESLRVLDVPSSRLCCFSEVVIARLIPVVYVTT